ncbi:Promethin-A, partial [Apaloderma vittatum]
KILFFHSQVAAFKNSRLGRYLDDRPFIALTLLVFVAVSAVPVAFFLIFVITTAIMSCISVMVMEGFVITVGGIFLLFVLFGLGALSVGVSGILSGAYMVISTLVNRRYSSKGPGKREEASRSSLQKSAPALDLYASNGK